MSRAGDDRVAARSRRSPRAALLLAVGLASVAVALALAAAGALDRAELRSYDLRLELRGDRQAPADVVIAAIDDRTLSELGVRQISRADHARLIERVAAARPRLIAYDVFFTEKTTPGQDRALVRSLQAAERRSQILLGAAKLREPATVPTLFLPPRRLRAIGVDVASLIITADEDGTFRRIDYAHEAVPALGIRAAELAVGTPLLPPDPGKPAWVDLHGPPGTFSTVSFVRVLRGEVPQAALRDKLVLVGATDATLSDRHPVAPDDILMAGVEFHANVMQTAREAYPLRDSGPAINAGLIAVLALFAPLLALRFSIRITVAVWLGALVAFLAAAQIIFEQGTVLAVLPPIVAAAVSLGSTLAVEGATVRRDRRRIRAAFARHVDPRVADEVLAEAGGDGYLAGTELEATVLFCDRRDWTAYVERTDPAQVVETLDRYLETVTRIVQTNGGAVVSFQGDGVMSVFGAPLPQSDHASRALAAARALLAEIPDPIGIGVASGSVISGTIGTGRRLEYTVTGNPTNLAARLQGLSRELSCAILASEATKEALAEADAKTLREAGELTVRGRSQPQRVWTPRAG